MTVRGHFLHGIAKLMDKDVLNIEFKLVKDLSCLQFGEILFLLVMIGVTD